MIILHIDCSPRAVSSESRRLSQAIVSRLADRHPHARIVRRELANGGIAHVDGDYAEALAARDPRAANVDQGSLAESERLIRELEEASHVVIGTPMHNFTEPSVLKAWIDHVVRVRRTFAVTAEGKVGLLQDRPVLVAVAAGGSYSSGRSRQPDFLTPYLTTVLATIGLHNVTFFSAQRLALGPQAVTEARQGIDEALAHHFLADVL
jgi:FMN-dependent NADH-azoreductase